MADAEKKPESENLEFQKFRLERIRHYTDLAKWVVAAIAAIISFFVIDLGNLRVEQFRATAENQRQLLEAYLNASEAPEPEAWRRKLFVLIKVADDERIRSWAQLELDYIDKYAERAALYRQAPKVASQLINPSRLDQPDRIQARLQFDQLYWVDLPTVKESTPVAGAMKTFRDALVAAEAEPDNKDLWSRLDGLLYALAKTLRDETPHDPRRPPE
jgi:hypothetical protein